MTLKRINQETILYHYFEFHNADQQIKYALFDSDMDMPVAYGSRNFVNSTVKNLPKYVTVVYYKAGTDGVTFHNPRFQKFTGQK